MTNWPRSVQSWTACLRLLAWKMPELLLTIRPFCRYSFNTTPFLIESTIKFLGWEIRKCAWPTEYIKYFNNSKKFTELFFWLAVFRKPYTQCFLNGFFSDTITLGKVITCPIVYRIIENTMALKYLLFP